jgi:hypothetical protein
VRQLGTTHVSCTVTVTVTVTVAVTVTVTVAVTVTMTVTVTVTIDVQAWSLESHSIMYLDVGAELLGTCYDVFLENGVHVGMGKQTRAVDQRRDLSDHHHVALCILQ